MLGWFRSVKAPVSAPEVPVLAPTRVSEPTLDDKQYNDVRAFITKTRATYTLVAHDALKGPAIADRLNQRPQLTPELMDYLANGQGQVLAKEVISVTKFLVSVAPGVRVPHVDGSTITLAEQLTHLTAALG